MFEPADLEHVWKLRHEVMWPDKDPEFVKIAGDEKALHPGIYEDGELVSVLSLFPEKDSVQFRKFCTRTDSQNRGLGSRLLEETIQWARSNGFHEIWCDAREEKTGFYEKFGFTVCSEPFLKSGKRYVRMEMRL